jgi:hypothetical protein
LSYGCLLRTAYFFFAYGGIGIGYAALDTPRTVPRFVPPGGCFPPLVFMRPEGALFANSTGEANGRTNDG